MRKSEGRDASLSGIGEAIDKYLRDHGLVRASRASQVPLLWSQVVGAWYAKHSEVLHVDHGIVHVRCDSAARAQQLQLDAPEIMKSLNTALGPGTVKEIRPSSGGIRRRKLSADSAGELQAAFPLRSELDHMDLLIDERAWIESLLASIEDEDLRPRLETVLVLHCKSERWKREHGFRPCEGCGALLPPPQRMCKACDPGRIPQQGSTDVLTNPYQDS